MGNVGGTTLNNFYMQRQHKHHSVFDVECTVVCDVQHSLVIQPYSTFVECVAECDSVIPVTCGPDQDFQIECFAPNVTANTFFGESSFVCELDFICGVPEYVDDLQDVAESDVEFVIVAQTLLKGNFVNIYNDAGVARVRKSDNVLGYQAQGYVLDNYNIGDIAKVYFEGNNNEITGAIAGPVFLFETGSFSHSKGGGTITQRIGVATDSKNINFEKGSTIRRL